MVIVISLCLLCMFARFIGIWLRSVDETERDIPSKSGVSTPALL